MRRLAIAIVALFTATPALPANYTTFTKKLTCEGFVAYMDNGYLYLRTNEDDPYVITCSAPIYKEMEKGAAKVLKICGLGNRCRISGLIVGHSHDIYYWIRIDSISIPPSKSNAV